MKKGEDGKWNWISSTKGDKIDIHIMELYDFAEMYNGNWEEIEKHIKVEYTYLDNDDRKNSFMEYAKKECDEFNKIKEQIDNIINKK